MALMSTRLQLDDDNERKAVAFRTRAWQGCSGFHWCWSYHDYKIRLLENLAMKAMQCSRCEAQKTPYCYLFVTLCVL